MGPWAPAGPCGPIAPTATLGNNVTLRSLLPSPTSTVRVSEFQPEFGMETTTLCLPTETLMLMGVTLPVSAPSTETWAFVGNEVTLNLPCSSSSARALPDISKSAAVNTVIQTIPVILRTLLGWFIESSLTLLAGQLLCADLTCDVAYFRGMLGEVAAIASPPLCIPQVTCFQ